jgi:hypothetical protein
MVGELVRREAEIAIAPLTINSQREQVRWQLVRGDSSWSGGRSVRGDSSWSGGRSVRGDSSMLGVRVSWPEK